MATNTASVLRREIRGFFFSPIAYIVIGLFLIVSGWTFFTPFFLDNRADMRDFFAQLPHVLSFVVPAITMRLFSDEYRTGTFEITRTLPLSLLAIVGGKFIAALVFVAVMLVPTVSYAIFVSVLGNLDWGPVLGGYAGAIMLGGAFCAIGVFASSLAKNQIVAYVIGLALCAAFTFIDRSIWLFGGGAAGVVQYLAGDFHFQNIAKGIFDTRDLVYFLSVAALALYGTALVLDRPRFRARSGPVTTLQIAAHAIFLVFIVVVNTFSGSLSARADLTQDKIHALSPVSRNTVAALREPVTVRVFFSRDLPSPYNSVERSVRDLLSSYRTANPQQFNYAFYTMTRPDESLSFNVEADTSENEALAQSYGVFPIQIQEVDEDEVKVTKAYMGAVIIQGDAIQRLDAVTTTDQLEYRLTTAIDELTRRTNALLSLDEPIAIEMYLSSSLYSLAPEFGLLVSEMEPVMAELNRGFYNRLTFELLDPDVDGSARNRAIEYFLPSIPLSREDGASVEAFASLVIVYEGEPFPLNLIVPTSSGASQLVDPETLKAGIEATVNSLLAPQDVVGYMVGNDTPPYRGFRTPRANDEVVSDLTDFYTLVTSEYEIDAFFARNGVPEGLRTAMVVGPRAEFSDYELFQLDQFVMRGGSLLLFMDSYDVYAGPAGIFYEDRNTRLEQMLEHYGVRLTDAYLLDEQSFVYRETQASGTASEIPIYTAPRVTNDQFNPDLRFLRNIDELVLVSVSPVEPVSQLPEGVIGTPLFWSSDEAWIIGGDLNFDPPNRSEPAGRTRGRHTMAYMLEGSFTSYFADRPIPTPPDVETVDADPFEGIRAAEQFLPSGSGGKVILIGTSTILGSNILGVAPTSPAARLLLASIDYLNDNEGAAELRSKVARVRRLGQTTPFDRAFTRYFNVAGLPFIVAVAGLLVWLSRRARRRRVERLFAEDAK